MKEQTQREREQQKFQNLETPNDWQEISYSDFVGPFLDKIGKLEKHIPSYIQLIQNLNRTLSSQVCWPDFSKIVYFNLAMNVLYKQIASNPWTLAKNVYIQELMEPLHNFNEKNKGIFNWSSKLFSYLFREKQFQIFTPDFQWPFIDLIISNLCKAESQPGFIHDLENYCSFRNIIFECLSNSTSTTSKIKKLITDFFNYLDSRPYDSTTRIKMAVFILALKKYLEKIPEFVSKLEGAPGERENQSQRTTIKCDALMVCVKKIIKETESFINWEDIQKDYKIFITVTYNCLNQQVEGHNYQQWWDDHDQFKKAVKAVADRKVKEIIPPPSDKPIQPLMTDPAKSVSKFQEQKKSEVDNHDDTVVLHVSNAPQAAKHGNPETEVFHRTYADKKPAAVFKTSKPSSSTVPTGPTRKLMLSHT